MSYLTEDYTLTSDGAAELLGYHVQYVRILARGGRLPAIKRYRQWYFNEKEIMEHLREMTNSVISNERAIKHAEEIRQRIDKKRSRLR